MGSRGFPWVPVLHPWAGQSAVWSQWSRGGQKGCWTREAVWGGVGRGAVVDGVASCWLRKDRPHD